MYYVNPTEVMEKFKRYLEVYDGEIPTDLAIEELQDAIDSASFEYVETEGE